MISKWENVLPITWEGVYPGRGGLFPREPRVLPDLRPERRELPATLPEPVCAQRGVRSRGTDRRLREPWPPREAVDPFRPLGVLREEERTPRGAIEEGL